MALLDWDAIMSTTSAILAIEGKEDTLSTAHLGFLVTLYLLAFLVSLYLLTFIPNLLHITFGRYASWGYSSNSCQASGSRRSAIKVYEINASLFVLNEPEPPITPEIDIVFFHGFQSGDSFDMRLRTWEILLDDGPCIWPSTWLLESFPKARVLYVSYDAVLGKISQGSSDLYIISENLVSDFLQAGIGQTPNCPVVLVGHCFGGIVLKQLCLDINKSISLERLKSRRIKLENFLRRTKGIFYYGTPHRGSPCVDKAQDLRANPLLQYFKILSKDASRMNSEFSRLCTVRPEWQIQGLGESIPTSQGVFQGVIVAPEACSRDGDEFNVVPADHVSITKPESITDRRFYALTRLLHTILDNKKVEVLGHQCTGLPDYPMGLEKIAQEVKESLKDHAILGIVGMGGIGKSTLARQVYNTISADFEYTCFIPNLKDIKGGLEDWVRTHFYRSGMSVDKIQWEELKDMETLIVADDVDSEDQLGVLPKLHQLGDSSKIIVTSRDKGILDFYEKHGVYEVKFLEMDVAKRLFCRHAFGQEDVPGLAPQMKHLERDVAKVVEKCDGLPLTLEVMGRYLRNHTTNANIWKETIKRLGNAQAIAGGKNDRVWKSLQVSYDALLSGEQEMFIEAATIFSSWPLSIVQGLWSTAIDAPDTSWANLINRSMVRVSSGHHYLSALLGMVEVVWVHDQLRDLARKLAKGFCIGEYGRQADELLVKLHSNEVNANTRMLELWHPSTPVQLDSLARLENLRYLDLDRVQYEGSSENFPRNLLRKLSMLRWWSSPGNTLLFPININDMNNLTFLQIGYWTVSKGFSKALGRLTNLRMLYLWELRGFDSLPEDLGKFSQLKELRLKSLNLLRLPESLGNLSALQYLHLEGLHCSELPESVGDLSSLVALHIERCEKLASLPTSFGRGLKSLKFLRIINCPLLECLPESFWQLRELQDLRIEECDQLSELGDSLGNLSALQCLELRNLNLAKLPENLGSLTCLQSLTIKSSSLERLPDSLGDLVRLKDLDLVISSVTTVPENLGSLASLQTLTIESDYLERVPNRLGDLVRLKDLHLKIKSVTALPDSLENLSSGLETLKITANSLESLPNNIGQLSSLRTLELIDCDCLEKLPESFGDLLSLERLSITSRRLTSLPGSIGRLQSMRLFTLDAERVMSLPESIGQLKSLQQFELCSCEKLERLPDGMDHLPLSSLALTLTGRGIRETENWLSQAPCRKGVAETLPNGLDSLSALEDLTLTHFSFRKLPAEIGKLSSLRSLKIELCLQLDSLPDSLGCISSLREMVLERCEQLQTLPDSLGRPFSGQVALPHEEGRDEKLVEKPTTQPLATPRLRLDIYSCTYLDESLMSKLGWVRTVVKKGWGKWYRREDAISEAL